jgi:hypothetical protein
MSDQEQPPPPPSAVATTGQRIRKTVSVTRTVLRLVWFLGPLVTVLVLGLLFRPVFSTMNAMSVGSIIALGLAQLMIDRSGFFEGVLASILLPSVAWTIAVMNF